MVEFNSRNTSCPFECRDHSYKINGMNLLFSLSGPKWLFVLLYFRFAIVRIVSKTMVTLSARSILYICIWEWVCVFLHCFVHINKSVCECVCVFVNVGVNVTFLVFVFYMNGDWYRNERFWFWTVIQMSPSASMVIWCDFTMIKCAQYSTAYKKTKFIVYWLYISIAIYVEWVAT